MIICHGISLLLVADLAVKVIGFSLISHSTRSIISYSSTQPINLHLCLETLLSLSGHCSIHKYSVITTVISAISISPQPSMSVLLAINHLFHFHTFISILLGLFSTYFCTMICIWPALRVHLFIFFISPAGLLGCF